MMKAPKVRFTCEDFEPHFVRDVEMFETALPRYGEIVRLHYFKLREYRTDDFKVCGIIHVIGKTTHDINICLKFLKGV